MTDPEMPEVSGTEAGPPARPHGGSKGVALTNWLVAKATGVLERTTSRRGFLIGSAMAGSAVAVAGCVPAVQPGSSYTHITDCGGGLCTDGYTEFCCTINGGINACPPNSFWGGWWRADYSSFCDGTRYYIDCMQNCCGPATGYQNFCAGCEECRCAAGCDTRHIYCNYFRYGQCHTEIVASGPIACRVVTCVPPYALDPACGTATLVDNATAEHTSPCITNPPPQFISAAVLPLAGAALASGGGKVGFFGRRPAGNVTYAEFDGSAWGPTVDLGGVVDSGLSAVADGSGRYVFARGSGNNKTWYRRNTGAGWTGWQTIAGNSVSDPAVVSSPDGLFVFVRGADDALWCQRGSGGSFSGYQTLGGGVTSDPAAVSDPSGVFVFVRGNDNGIYVRRFVSSSWAAWQPLGGVASSDCSAVSDPSGVFVFVRGGDNSLYFRQLVSGSWSEWQSLGGGLSSDPYAVSDSSGLYVFCRGNDHAVWYRRAVAGTWEDWQSLGGGALVGPVAASDPASGLFLFAEGNDSALWYRRHLSGSWSGWQSLGGTFAPVRAAR